MKKQNKIIIGLIIAIAVVILIVSFFFPSVYKGLTSGSFGKVDKYHQEQMTENDIQLRSDLTKDTAQLRQMITGLIYFALFTDNLSMTIDTCMVSYKLQGFDKDPVNAKAICLLLDYSSFLKNNSKTLAATTRMLAGFLLQDTASGSDDVEKNIRDFANYVNQVNVKDSVLMLALARVDSYLVGNRTLQKKQDEIRNLKAIRDQLVIKSAQFMAMTGNKQGLGSMLSYAVQSQAQFNGIGALKVIMDGAAASLSSIPLPIRAQEAISASTSNLSVAFNAAALQSATAGAKVSSTSALSSGVGTTDAARSGLNLIVYDKANLQMTLCSAGQLQVIYGSEKMNSVLQGKDPNLGCLGALQGKQLGIVLNAGLLCNALSSSTLSSVFSASLLNEIIPARDLANASGLQSMVGSKAGLQMGLCGNQALQMVVGNNAGLQRLYSNMNAMNGISSLQSMSMGVIPPSP